LLKIIPTHFLSSTLDFPDDIIMVNIYVVHVYVFVLPDVRYYNSSFKWQTNFLNFTFKGQFAFICYCFINKMDHFRFL